MMLLCILIVALTNFAYGLPHGRIIGGESTHVKDYPYQVSIMVDDEYNCGGSIISDRWILTAAHCLKPHSSRRLSVRVGSDFVDREGTVHEVRAIVWHQQFAQKDYDYGLVELVQPIKFNVLAQPIGLPKQDETVKDGTLATVTGWGLIEPEVLPDFLQKVSVPIVGQQSCKESLARPITDRMLCAGYSQGGKDACTGDSGGPLVIGKIQVGIVSFGKDCAQPNSPGVYANVADQRNWIQAYSNV